MNSNDFQSINELKRKISQLENKNQNILRFNNNLSNENKNLLFNIKEKEKEIIKLKNISNEKDLIIENLEKKNFKYKKHLMKLLQIINQNNIKINMNISPSINNTNILNNSLKYDCEFLLDINNNILRISKEEIQYGKIINFSFNIISTGTENWPIDTILKCNPDESNIFFFHVKYNSDEILEYKEKDKIIKVFPVRILFKNYNKINEKNILNCFLFSDREGKIGNKFGSMKLIVENL